MKAFILSVAGLFDFGDPEPYDFEKIEQIQRYFLVPNTIKDFPDCVNEVDRNFIFLCSLMEDNGATNPQNYTVLHYYGKIAYINEKNKTTAD